MTTQMPKEFHLQGEMFLYVTEALGISVMASKTLHVITPTHLHSPLEHSPTLSRLHSFPLSRSISRGRHHNQRSMLG